MISIGADATETIQIAVILINFHFSRDGNMEILIGQTEEVGDGHLYLNTFALILFSFDCKLKSNSFRKASGLLSIMYAQFKQNQLHQYNCITESSTNTLNQI